MKILVTGGAGYIGSHTTLELLNSGHDVIVADNLSNSSQDSLKRVEQITNKNIVFYEMDLRDKIKLDKLFAAENIEAVIHFAGLKSVGESVAKPLYYYQNNLDSTLNLLDIMNKYGVKKLVFSSSATVYGSAEIPYKENMLAGIGITNPYARSKYIIETILHDASMADPECEFISLRYFNPIGAHPSGLIGEDPSGIPNNLMPFIAQVASGARDKLMIFGSDYNTPDGTGVRDYIHVCDLATGHLRALMNLKNGFKVYNLGSGEGTSVLELIGTFEKITGKKIPYEITDRRPGDLAEFYADPSLANDELGWKAELTVEDACRDAWKWQSQNPNGYE